MTKTEKEVRNALKKYSNVSMKERPSYKKLEEEILSNLSNGETLTKTKEKALKREILWNVGVYATEFTWALNRYYSTIMKIDSMKW